MRFALWTGALLVIAAIAAALHYWSPHATLRITTGPFGTDAQRFMGALITEVAKDHPRVRLQPVQVDSLAASSKAIESGDAELALVRSDVSPPSNGQTIAILRRDVVAFVLPPKSPIDSIGKLSGKTIAIPQGRLQDVNAALLDTILSYYNVAPHDVKRVFLSADEMIAAVHGRHVAAILAVGPVGPGDVVGAVTAMAKGTAGTPTILAFSDADAFNKRFPAFESYDVPEGAFRSRPATPDDSVTTLSVTYRLVAPDTMLSLVAGAIGRTLFTSKAKLVALTPLASQIEAPDPDAKNPILPVHPGVASYLNNGEQSFFDELQGYFYLGAAALSILGSLATIIMGRVKTGRMREEQKRIGQLIQIADQAQGADADTLEALEHALHQVIGEAVTSAGRSGSDSTTVLAINHARYALAARRTFLRSQGGRSSVQAAMSA
ncbi:TAXI family TRAP transporter solute-binding subunit [Bosea sp. BK604]|uniref:TAXI family TRAP transporter solute-binding subunit n=1 Tax=Bosea sp. BK604 TaxID=2512180 RepID=UPI0010E4CB3A|nr:TAXI family TRAP transporter solute-binding subunit [Bosea sp. BK604]TCR70479.1 TRAP transporter TAXI family solute receptor [Bosea sp. BK604]